VGRTENSRRNAQARDRHQSSQVAKYLVRRRRPPSQTWRTFLRNHADQIVAADFFVVPTVTCRLLFVLVMMAHHRHPSTTAWTSQQLREAFPEDKRSRNHQRDAGLRRDPCSVPDAARLSQGGAAPVGVPGRLPYRFEGTGCRCLGASAGSTPRPCASCLTSVSRESLSAS
jgi:hypothetical protein